ncbi:MAG: T9SS C-terminal target domain-containing protein [Cyclobacteriaceae bacterium]|nr:T9SS C-terminal target domain-containing protein [Cyclobacteriaceae bacterium]
MKNLFNNSRQIAMLSFLLGLLFLSSCITNDPAPIIVPTSSVEITQTITTNTTWTADKKYILKGIIYVQAPAELTIQAGTIIFGDKVTKGALVITRGAKIHAIGTAAKPIIFTSASPQGSRNYGDWGGVVILGKAQNNQSSDQAIEGISAPTGDNGRYGIGTESVGSTENDNSGEFQYVRIEFAGIALSTDNELNGLTLGGVGKSTKVDHIQVSFSGDDSYEWFGGSVNSSYLIAYKGWDDEFDTDFGYSGYNQFLVSFRDPNVADKSGSNGFESDNNAQGDGKTPQTSATFANVTFFGPYMYAPLTSEGNLNADNLNANYKRGAHIRRNTALKVYNSVFAGTNKDGIFFDQASGSAVVKGNYIGRITGAALPTPVANALAGGIVYDASNFANDNMIESPINKVNVSSLFAGSTNNLWLLATPSALLANGSTLLTGAVTTPTFPTGFGFTTVAYRGAFDATNNWASASWTNYDPNNTAY